MELAIHMFSTSTCPNCAPLKAALEAIDSNYPDVYISYTVADKEADGMLKAQEWGVSAVPTLIFIQNAVEVGRKIGNMSIQALEGHVKGYLQFDVLQESPGGGDETSPALLCSTGEQKD